MAPAIEINDIDITIDFDKSEIDFKEHQIKSYLAKRSSCQHRDDLTGIESKIRDKFKDMILKDIIEDVKEYVQTTFEDEINKELYDYGTHYDVGDYVGFDFSLTKSPQVTDD